VGGSHDWRRQDNLQSTAWSTLVGDSDAGPGAAYGRDSRAQSAYGFATSNDVGLLQTLATEAALNGQHMGTIGQALAQRNTLSVLRQAGSATDLRTLTDTAGRWAWAEQTLTSPLGRGIERFSSAANRVLAPIGLGQGLSQFGDGLSQVVDGDAEGLVDMMGGAWGATSAGISIADMAGVAGAGAGELGAATAVGAAPLGATVGAAAAGGAGGIALAQRGQRYTSESGLLGQAQRRATARGFDGAAEAARGRDWSDWAADNGVAADNAVRRYTGSEGAGTLAGLGATAASSVAGAVGAAATGARGLVGDVGRGASWLWHAL
jgi:hypothetical protein